MTPEQKLHCTPTQGRLTTASGEYPDALVHTILEHISKIVRLREPQRFNINAVFAVAHPVQDLTEWNDIVAAALQHFERASKRPYLIDPSTEVGKRTCGLMRMDAIRIQVVWTPTTRRLPPSALLEMTHRGALLQFADGTHSLELEHLSELQFPKQRFVKPVQVGIFTYGVMREVQGPSQQQDDARPSSLPLRDLPTDVTFRGLPEGISVDTRRMVARLHLNLGHPSSQELTRMIAHYGGAPGHVLSCIQHLLAIDSRMFRRPDPQPHLPSQLVNLLMKSKVISSTSDCWMARTLACWACWTEQQGFIKPSCVTPETPSTRDSQAAFVQYLDIWVKPYGVPYRLLLDPDPTFRGEFQRQAESLATVVEYCPAEAHWMVGAVERRNATLRCILEQLIDQWTVLDLEQFNRILPNFSNPCHEQLHLYSWKDSLSSCLWKNSQTTRRALHRWLLTGFESFNLESAQQHDGKSRNDPSRGSEAPDWFERQPAAQEGHVEKDKSNPICWTSTWATLCLLALAEKKTKETWSVGSITLPCLGSQCTNQTGMAIRQCFDFANSWTTSNRCWLRELGPHSWGCQGLEGRNHVLRRPHDRRGWSPSKIAVDHHHLLMLTKEIYRWLKDLPPWRSSYTGCECIASITFNTLTSSPNSTTTLTPATSTTTDHHNSNQHPNGQPNLCQVNTSTNNTHSPTFWQIPITGRSATSIQDTTSAEEVHCSSANNTSIARANNASIAG